MGPYPTVDLGLKLGILLLTQASWRENSRYEAETIVQGQLKVISPYSDMAPLPLSRENIYTCSCGFLVMRLSNSSYLQVLVHKSYGDVRTLMNVVSLEKKAGKERRKLVSPFVQAIRKNRDGFLGIRGS